MIKNFINNIKLTKLSYLLEIIEVRDFKSKIRAFNKIKRMKITKEMGLMILDDSNFDHPDDFSDFNISLSLISLVFNEYYDEYSDKIKEIFPKLTNESKYEVANLLACTNNESAIKLYKKLVLKYFTNMDNIPIGNLSTDVNNYSLLFPDLFKTFNFDIKRNNVILLFNDFLSAGVVLEKDIKKNKKILQNAVIDIFKQGSNFKFAKNENHMQNKEYINLRIFLESAINIEFYVTGKNTQTYLDKLYKKKDNQLKLFILDNYVRRDKNISKFSFNTIAKDELSRYPLFSFLNYYNLSRLMPKKYNNNIELGKSDLFINYSISNNYNFIPQDMEFVKEMEYDGYKYYFYKFKSNYNYYEEVQDPATDYILKNVEVDRSLIENTYTEYLGMSGGYNKDIDPSIIENNVEFKVVKIDKDIDLLINELLPKKKGILPIITKKEEIVEPEEIKEEEEVKETKKKKQIQDVEDKELIKETTKVSLFARLKNKFKKKEKVEKAKPVKEKKVKEKVVEVQTPEEEKVEKELNLFFKIIKKIFCINTFLVTIFILFIVCCTVLVLYVLDIDVFGIKNSNKYAVENVVKSKIDSDKYIELAYNDIFNKEQNEYYVLFYKKSESSEYHTYINELIENNYTIYYVDLNIEYNNAIFQGNETGFVIKDETLLKVKDKEYAFYVVGKKSILREFEDYIDALEEKKEKENLKSEEEKKLESKKKAAEKAKEIEEKNKKELEEKQKLEEDKKAEEESKEE
ncbi:MAG: hypothetical protein IKF36_03225 [Bacilli bacterium]|nr:hypothetical protein [Bacilli bacterium]